MSFTIRLNGGEALRDALENMSDEIRQEVKKAVLGTALELKGDVQENISHGAKTGTVYYRIPGEKYMTVRAGSMNGPPVAFIPGGGTHNLSMRHQASAPGQSPATDTGRLVNSITSDMTGPLTATVGSNLAYAVYLEYGTTRMAARPFFRPAVEEIRPKFISRLEKALGDAIQ